MRDNRIDLLRFIGLAMIIFAHIGPPSVLFQLRNFDVPLMVLVSGMAFGLSYKASEAYLSYIWKRIMRLLFPVWIFLTIYFIILAIFQSDSAVLNFKTIFTSYTLIDGIGYVWIIKVFLLVALVSPFIFTYNKNTNSHSIYFLVLTTYFLVYEIMRYLSLPYIHEGIGRLISLITHDIIPYSIVFAVGLRLPSLNKNQLLSFSFFNLGILILIGIGLFLLHGEFIATQQFKYPPSIYYFSYSFFVSCLLWIYINSIELFFDKIKIKNIVLFIAQNTIWIYLWHIPLINLIHTNFALKYGIILITSTIIVYFQIWIVNNFILNRVSNNNLKKNLKTLFTG